MIYQFSRRIRTIFVDYGECRRGYVILLHTQGAADCRDKRGLPRSHFAMERKHRVFSYLPDKLFGGSVEIRNVFYDYLFHFSFFISVALPSLIPP